jgi:hypothetical protein
MKTAKRYSSGKLLFLSAKLNTGKEPTMHKSIFYHIVMRFRRQHEEMHLNYSNKEELGFSFGDLYDAGAQARYFARLCEGTDFYNDLPCNL